MTTSIGHLNLRSRGRDLSAIAAIGLGGGLTAVVSAPLVSNPLAYAVGVPVLVIGAVAILWDWRVGVILAATALPLAGLTAPGVSASAFRVIVVGTTVSVGVRWATDGVLRRRLTRLVRSQPIVFLGAYLVWMAASVLWAERTDLWATQLVASAGFAVLAVLVALADRRTIERMWMALLVSSVVAIPLAQLFSRSVDYISRFRRFSIGGGDPNEMATLLAVAVGITIAWGYRTDRSRLLSAVTILILGAAIVLTGSRSGTAALIAVVAGAGLIALFNRHGEPTRPRSARVGRSIAIWAAAAVLFLAVASLVADRIDIGLDLDELATAGSARVTALARFDSDVDLSGRQEIWTAMSVSVRERPVLGMGAGNAELVSLNAGLYSGLDATRGSGPHNTILQTLVEGGVVGAGLYLAVWFTAAAYLVALWRREDPFAGALALGLLAWAVAGLVLGLQDQKIAALLLGSIIGVWLSIPAPSADEARIA